MTGSPRPNRPSVDIAIITIREDEERAVLKRMRGRTHFEGKRQIYAIADISVGADQKSSRTVAAVRCSSEGQAVAQATARDVIDDLNPGTIFVVGIGGGFPSTEFTLGDVIVATRIQDLRVMALLESKDPEVDTRGGPVEPEVERIVAALQRVSIGPWNSRSKIGLRQPGVSILEERLYGPAAWKDKVKAALIARFGPDGSRQLKPRFTTGAMVSTDYLVKQVATVKRWQTHVRKAIGCEMETAGVFHAARTPKHTYPVYGIRGISDVIGFKREEEWTAYACESAAAFSFALIRTGLIPMKRRRAAPTTAAREVNTAYFETRTPTTHRSRYVGARANDLPDTPDSRTFRPALSFIDRGEVEAAVSAILSGTPYDRAEPTAQISIASCWQKFGFTDEATECLNIIFSSGHWSRLNLQQQVRCRVIGLKISSQTAEFRRVQESYKTILGSLSRLGLREHRAAVYRRAAIAYAATGDPAAARRCVARAQSIDATLLGEHSRTTGKVFAAITLALGMNDSSVTEGAVSVLKEAPGTYLSGEMDRSSFQAHPLKSAVMCLFSEAAVRMVVNGESSAAWICLTASYVLAPMGSAHPRSEGYAELLGLLQSRQEYWQMFRLAMSPESAQRREFPAKYPNVNRYLARCQTLPDLVQGRNSASWEAMRRNLDSLIAQE